MLRVSSRWLPWYWEVALRTLASRRAGTRAAPRSFASRAARTASRAPAACGGTGAVPGGDRPGTPFEEDGEVLWPQAGEALQGPPGELPGARRVGRGPRLSEGRVLDLDVLGSGGRGAGEALDRRLRLPQPLEDLAAEGQEVGPARRLGEGGFGFGEGRLVVLLAEVGDRQVGVAQGVLRGEPEELGKGLLGFRRAFVLELGDAQVAEHGRPLGDGRQSEQAGERQGGEGEDRAHGKPF
jgi:hypothetical protein